VASYTETWCKDVCIVTKDAEAKCQEGKVAAEQHVTQSLHSAPSTPIRYKASTLEYI